jgi:hypothetical protein
VICNNVNNIFLAMMVWFLKFNPEYDKIRQILH